MTVTPAADQIAVVGIGADGWPGLSPTARAEIEAAEVLFGGRRQLELIPADAAAAQRVEWPSPLLPALDGLLKEHADRRICVLASGDPLLSGIGSTLVRRYGAAAVRVIPAVSSATLARARLGWPAEGVEVITTVGRNPHRVVRALAPGRRLLVLSSGADTPGEITALLREHCFSSSAVITLANLGGPDEQRFDGTASDWPHTDVPPLNVVAIECVADPGARVLGVAPGLPDDAFEHDGQLTKRDVRASALAHLAPTPGALLWDVGAGAGSVAIEWLRVHPANRATAVERDPERAARIERNAERLGVPELHVVVGAAPAALPEDEQPDAVFVGGGVSSPGLLDACLKALAPRGRLVAHAVTLQSEQALAAAYAEHGGELSRIGVEHAAALGSFTGWSPARTVTQWSLST